MKLAGRLSLLLATALIGCAQLDVDSDDETPVVTNDPRVAAMAPPAGTQRGEPYRWLARTWTSPLGLTVKKYGLAIDGLSIYGRQQIEMSDAGGAVVYRAGSADALLAELQARGTRVAQHPSAKLASGARSNPLAHRTQRAVWYAARGGVVPAIVTDELDLLGATPRGEIAVHDAATNAELTRHRTLFELEAPQYQVYANDDGRPLTSPLGNLFPHPSGVPDGSRPAPVAQQLRDQHSARYALDAPWLPAGATQTSGNNVIAFFNSLLTEDGILAYAWDDDGIETAEYGPQPDAIGNDFFANATAGKFAFPYDATNTVNEYFQDAAFSEEVMDPPDPNDPAINAKIVEAFYATNWLHDFFYRAGYDEVAGNPQQDNFGRGGVGGDPLIVHAGFQNTFTTTNDEGVSPVLDLGLNTRTASKRDLGMDFTVLSHEWGHTLIGRLTGGLMDPTAGMSNVQGLALHEGIADFVGLLVNFNAGDDPRATYTVGAYGNLDYIERRPTLPPVEAPADMYFGIRRYPNSLDFAKNPLTLRHLAEAPPTNLPYYNWKGRGPLLGESHTAGEVFGQALYQCFGSIVDEYPARDFEYVRLRMAQYLVAGLAMFPDHPSFLEARNAFLAAIRHGGSLRDYRACRAGFAARGMGVGALGPDGEYTSDIPYQETEYNAADIVESYVAGDHALHLASSTVADGAVHIALRNTGLVDELASVIEVVPAVARAARFPLSRFAIVGRLAPETVANPRLPVVLDACKLPASQPGLRAFDYKVKVLALGVHREASFHVDVPASCP